MKKFSIKTILCTIIMIQAVTGVYFFSSQDLGELSEIVDEWDRKRGRDYEFVDVEIGCKCGQKIKVESDSHWPFEFTCAKCLTKYVINKYPDSNNHYVEEKGRE